MGAWVATLWLVVRDLRLRRGFVVLRGGGGPRCPRFRGGCGLAAVLAGGAAGVLAAVPGGGGLGVRGRRVLLPGGRDAVRGPGQRSCDGAAGLAGDRAGAGGLPAPVPAGLLLPGPGDGDGARTAEGDRQGPFH